VINNLTQFFLLGADFAALAPGYWIWWICFSLF